MKPEPLEYESNDKDYAIFDRCEIECAVDWLKKQYMTQIKPNPQQVQIIHKLINEAFLGE